MQTVRRTKKRCGHWEWFEFDYGSALNGGKSRSDASVLVHGANQDRDAANG
jgi:hypothetical protein